MVDSVSDYKHNLSKHTYNYVYYVCSLLQAVPSISLKLIGRMQ